MLKKARAANAPKPFDDLSQVTMLVRLDANRVEVEHDDYGVLTLRIKGPRLPHYGGPRLTEDFLGYLDEAGINPDVVVDAMLDAVEYEAGIAAIRSVRM